VDETEAVTHTGKQLTSSSVTLTECGVVNTTANQFCQQLEEMSTAGREDTTFGQNQSNQENTKFSQHQTPSNKPNQGIESLEAEEGGKVVQSKQAGAHPRGEG
jgi:hypothetical protein